MTKVDIPVNPTPYYYLGKQNFLHEILPNSPTMNLLALAFSLFCGMILRPEDTKLPFAARVGILVH
jgi:hypothetical protein